jgi:Lon protease-like protein
LLRSTEQLVRRTLALTAELGEVAPPDSIKLSEDPKVAAWQLIAIAPLGPFDKQRLLQIDDHTERLRLLESMAEEERAVLAYRLAGD